MSLIRTSFHGSFAALRVELLKQGSSLAKATEQSLTGKRVSEASDDPTAAALISKLRAQQSDLSAWGDNAAWAMSLSQTTEDALAGIETTFQSAQELMVQASSETYTADDLAEIAVEMQALKDQLISLGNTNVAGRYVFAGTAYDTEPFDTTGAYQGNTDTPSTRVAQDTWVDTGWDGSAIMGEDVDVMALFDDVITALEAGDHDTVSSLLGDLETASEQAARYRTDNGVAYNTAEDAASVSESMAVLVAQQLAGVEEVDTLEAYQTYAEMTAAYEAALSVSANATQVGSLFKLI